MVMNTFRSKLRRRRNELFRRSSDEESDEWQFVAFNPTVYPCQPPSGGKAALNGNYASPASTADDQTTSSTTHKAVLRPWVLKRASWHDGPPPPVPPHGGNTSTTTTTGAKNQQRPLPPCPELSSTPPPPAIPPHGPTSYPGSIPNWYGSQIQDPRLAADYQQPPPPRPPHAERPPVVLRRPPPPPAASPEEDSPAVSPEGAPPPLVPPHGCPVVPQHLQPPSPPPPPPPPPPSQGSSEEPQEAPPPPPVPMTLLDPLLLLQPLPPSPPGENSSSSSPCSSSAAPVSPSRFHRKDLNQGEKIGVGSGGIKEQRRSDPGGGGGPGILSNHQNPSNGASVEDDQQQQQNQQQSSSTDDPDHSLSESQTATSIDSPSNNVSKSQSSHKKRSGSSINRSESCKEKQHVRKQARENRKNSDPNIPTSKSGDVDGDNPLSFHSGSSSNSSLSQSQESPPPAGSGGNSAEQVEAYASALDNDSDIEAEADLPDWTQRLSPEVVERLSSKDRKRQDTINEFFHTEQSHVRVLKVLQYLFHQPLRQSGYVSSELLDRLFPNLDQMLKFHTSFNKSMKKRRQESPLVSTVGDILSSMFDGEEGAQFQQAAAEFVACQSFALESLKQQQKRDQKLLQFLQDQENHPHCRRLQLKDMLPAGFQRLSKYPLLLESLLSFTDRTKQSEEYEQIAKALERSKEILAYVNAAVQDAENHKRLREIQKRLDQSSLVKNKHGNCEELRGEMDLTKHKLIYEGPLTWKTARGQKNIDLHVLILEDCVVLLQKDNDKYVLKYHSMNKSLGKDDNKLNLSPIIKFGTFLCREVATDKCGIFIILTQSTLSAQIYELVTVSPMERSMWLRHLHEAQANYNAREGRNRRHHPTTPHNIPDPDQSTPSADLRDVEDGVDAEPNDSIEVNNENSTPRSKQETLDGQFHPSTAPTSASSAPQTPSSPETLAKKTESGAPASSSNSSVGGTGSAPQQQQQQQASPSSSLGPPRRRLQEVQIIQIVEGPSLIQPSEVKVSQGVVLSAEPVLTPIELLRRKDTKIRQELEEKQHLIADILNIPYQDFESVADMAGEVGLSNKEPKELVLGAIFQAKKLQETLNEAQTIRDSDIISAQACGDSVSSRGTLPLYQTSMETMERLLNISGTLTQFLNSLMVLISERDEERERMRKELISSRERVHQLHMQQNAVERTTTDAPSSSSTATTIAAAAPVHASTDGASPTSSRPSSFVSVNSSNADQFELADQHNTDEEGKTDDLTSTTAEVQSTSQTSIIEKCEETGTDAPSLPEESTDEGSGDRQESEKQPQQLEETGST